MKWYQQQQIDNQNNFCNDGPDRMITIKTDKIIGKIKNP